MWKNLYIEKQLSKSFLKAARRAGHIKLAKPKNDYEIEQIKRLSTDINRSRRENAALYYSLMFENIILNENSWGGNYLFESDDEENFESRPIIESISSDLESFISLTDPQKNNFIQIHTKLSDMEKMNLFAMCEPLIWQSWKKAGKDRINREVLRDILDFMVFHPEQAVLIHDVEDYQSRSNADWKEILSPFNYRYKLDDYSIGYLLSTISITYVKGIVAGSSVLGAQRLDACFPVYNTSFGKNRLNYMRNQVKVLKDNDIIAGVKLFLDEIDYFPVISDFNDVIKIRNHSGFMEFRENLNQWIVAISSGNYSEEQKMRNEIRSSNLSLRKAMKCEQIGRYFVYLALPLMVLDAVIAPIFGPSLTISGFGLQAYADWIKSQNKWLMIGKSN